jgi:hypothetical protein
MGLSAGSYEVTPSNRWVSGECPNQADGSSAGQSTRTSAGFKRVRPGSGTHPNADGQPHQSGGPSPPTQSSLPAEWRLQSGIRF